MNYNENKKLTVINIWGGPGSGKSLNAAGLFHLMKKAYISCELVTEYAKNLVWSERGPMFSEQDYIFAKQNHTLRRLVGKVQFAIIDSPLPTSLMYLAAGYPETFAPFVLEVFRSYTNINLLLERNHSYDPVGRNQDEEGARAIDTKIGDFLRDYNILHMKVPTSDDTADNIYSCLETLGVFHDDHRTKTKEQIITTEETTV